MLLRKHQRDILRVLTFKGIALWVIWACFFSHPMDQSLTLQTLHQHLFHADHDR